MNTPQYEYLSLPVRSLSLALSFVFRSHFSFKLELNNYGIIIIICKCPAAADTLITPADIAPLKDTAGVH